MLKQRQLLPLVICVVALSALSFNPLAAQQRKVVPAEAVQMSLDDCLRMALANNLDLVSARKDPEISEQRVRIEDATFDINLTSEASRAESKQEVIFNLFSTDSSQRDSAEVGVNQNLFFGGSYSATLSGNRSSFTGPLVTTETSYGSTLSLTLNVPLLRGLGTEFATETLIRARRDLEISGETLRIEAHRVMETVESAYWDVLAAHEELRIARLALKRAQDLLKLNRKKVEVGTLAPIEITEAEAGVASQEESVIVAETTLENAEDELLRLLAVPSGSPMWDQHIDPTDRPSFEPVRLELADAMSVAMERRPEIITARKSLLNEELSERAARNQMLPGLDLTLNASPSGDNVENFGFLPGGEPINLPVGKLAESVEEIPRFDNYSWSVALNFAYPIGNRSAKASYAIAQLNREKGEIDLRNQEQTIRVDIRQAVRNVDSGHKRVEAARKNVELQQKKLNAEQKKFDNGMSTSFEVLTFQNDLASAERSEIQARLDYVKSLTALERAKGTLLEARGLSLAP